MALFDDLIPGNAKQPAGLFDDLIPKVPERNTFAKANDFMIDTANAAAGLVKSGVDLVAPGSEVSNAIGGFIKQGQADQSDFKQYERAKLARDLQNADGEWAKAGAYLKHAVVDDPLGTAAEAAGNIGPFGMLGKATAGLSAGARTAIGTGMSAGLSMGEVRGNIWDKISNTSDADLMQQSPEYAQLRQSGMTEGDAKIKIGQDFTRNLPELAAVGAVGALGGKFGVEAMAEGVAPKLAANRIAAAGLGMAQEGSEGAVEQLATNKGVQRAIPSQSLTEDVLLNAAQEGMVGIGGAALGGKHATADYHLQRLAEAKTVDEAIAAANDYINAPLALPAPPDKVVSNWELVDGTPPQLTGPTNQAPLALPAPTEPQPFMVDSAGNAAPMPDTVRTDGLARQQAQADAAAQQQQATADLGLTPDIIRAQQARNAPELTDVQLTPQPPVEVKNPPKTRLTEGVELQRPDPVQGIVDLMRRTNTPQARAFVQEYEAGRITDDDIRALVRREQDQQPQARIERAAAEAPKPAGNIQIDTGYRARPNLPAGVLPTDLLTKDNKPYGSRDAAYIRSKRDGGRVVEVDGGYVVRTEDAPDTALQPADTGAGRAADAGRDIGAAVLPPGPGDVASRPAVTGDQSRASVSPAVDGRAGDDGALTRPAGQSREFTNSLSAPPASWVIRDKATGDVVMETSQKSVAEKINTEKYEAVPVLEHLQQFNAAGRKAGGVQPAPGWNRASATDGRSPTVANGRSLDTAPAITSESGNTASAAAPAPAPASQPNPAVESVSTPQPSGQAATVKPRVYKTRDAAYIESKRSGGAVEAVDGGWVVRDTPKLNRSDDATDRAEAGGERDLGLLNDGVSRARGGEGADSVRPYVAAEVPGNAALQDIAAAFGKRFQGFRLRPDLLAEQRRKFGFFNGAYLKGTIYLRAEGNDRPHLSILGHELLHQMRKDSPALYDRFVDAVRPYVDTGRYEQEFRNLPVARDAGNADLQQEEFMAEVLSDGFMDKQFWRALGDRNPSLLSRVVNMLGDLIDRIKASVGYSKRTERFLTDYDRVMQIAGEVMAEYGASRGRAGSAADASPKLARNDGDVTKTEAFRRWFGGSKVVDAQGRPLVVYHGSPDLRFINIDGTFKSQKERYGMGASEAAHWFTPSMQTAKTYADPVRAFDYQNAEEGVISAYLKLENPLIVDAAGANWRDAQRRGRTSDVIDEARQNGHDGVIIRNVKDNYLNDKRTKPTDTYVVFDSKQIKSATDNSGDFDPTNPDIRFNRQSYYGDLTPDQEKALNKVIGTQRKSTLKQRWDGLRADFGLKARQYVVDQFAAIKDLDQQAYLLARMSKGTDGTLEAAMLYGRPFLRDGVPDVDIKDGGFAKTLADLQGEHQRFLVWIAAQRAEQLKAKGLENLFDFGDIQALKTLNAGRMADGKSRQMEYAKAAKRLEDFNASTLQMARDSGLIDDQAVQIMSGTPYVPFYRLMDDGGAPQGPRFSSGLTGQQAFKKLKGGTNQLNEDLLANTLQNWAHLYGAAAKNRAALASIDAAVKAGIAYPVPSGTKGAAKVMRDGVAEHYMVEDPYLMEAISAVHYTPPSFIKPLAAFKRWLTMGVTASPVFKIKNLMRDSIAALAVSDLGVNVIENVAKGYKATDRNSQTYASMLASGGVLRFGSSLEGNQSAHAQAVIDKMGGTVLDESGWQTLKRKLSDLAEAYNEIGDRSENVNRAALYEQLRAKGYSHADASFASRDLMDFSMQGTLPVIRFLAQTVPFLNARIQGLYKLGSAATSGEKYDAIGLNKRFTHVAGAVAMASLALMLANEDEDWWKKREDWDRDTYWAFKVGDQIYRIPKPFEVGAIGTLAERTWEMMFNKDMDAKRYKDRISAMLFQTFAFNPTPQIFKPIMDVYANQDSFTGRPIESMGLERLRPEDRKTESTTAVAQMLGAIGLPDPGALMNARYEPLSPVQIDYMIRGYFGWMGASIAFTADAAARQLQDKGERPDFTLKDLTGGFAAKVSEETGSRYLSRFYEDMKGIEQAYASYTAALKSGDAEKAREIMAEDGDKIAQYKRTEAIKRGLTTISQQIKRVEEDKTLSGEEKRIRIDALRQRRAEFATPR